MNKKMPAGIALTLMAITAAITFSVTMVFSTNIYNQKISNLTERENMYSKIAEIDKIVRQNYAGTIDETELFDNIAAGYLNGISDRYSTYISAKNYATMLSRINGELVGIGVEMVSDVSGYIRVVDVYAGSPAQQAGIIVGDLIVKIDGEDVAKISYADAATRFAGAEGSKIKLTIRHEAADSDMELTRKRIDVQGATWQMDGKDAYIKIKGFNSNAWAQFNNAVDSAISSGAEGLIFDLRNNGGGLIESCAQMLDKLLPEGDIVSGTDNKGKTEVLYRSNANSVSLPMVVIVNGDTASAAELFSAALRDYNKAKLIGTNTFGKGVMQNIFKLVDGSAIDFTTGKFNPPSGVNFDGVGLKPDFEVTLTADQQKSWWKLTVEDDPQILKAKEVLQSLKRIT